MALLLAILVLGACDLASPPSPGATASPGGGSCGRGEVEGGGINGRVVDTEGRPLEDIFILIQTTDGFRGDARTGADGVFTAPDVAGEFQITTVDIGHVQVVREVLVPCGELVDVELVLTPVEG